MLRHVRSVLVRAPHVGLLHLGRLDERIAAHLDGLAVAGEYGSRLCLAALERPGCGEVFAPGAGVASGSQMLEQAKAGVVAAENRPTPTRATTATTAAPMMALR